MRFAITGTDKYLGIFEAFIRAGWTPLKLFTVPIRQPNREDNFAMTTLAEERGVPIQLSRMQDCDMRSLKDQGCEVLVVASYKWRIGDWQSHIDYAINFHASPLPDGKGPYPMVRALMERRPFWAITCHKIAHKFDSGDILAAQHFPLTASDCHETMDLKLQIAARRLATEVAGNFTALWQAAKPQDGGSYWPLWSMQDRTIDFNQTVNDIMRTINAFGLLECIAHVNNRWLTIRRAVSWEEGYGPPPGTVAHVNGKTIVVAARNGYIGLIEWDFVGDETANELEKTLQ